MARLGRSLPGVHVWSRPTVISGPPNYIRVSLVVATNTVAARTRSEMRRHYPLQGWSPFLQLETPGTVGATALGVHQPLVGIRPPAVIDPLPTQQQQTVAVRSVAVQASRQHPSRDAHASRPVVAFSAFIAPPVTVANTAVEQRLARLRRGSHYQLNEPTVLQTFTAGTPRLTRVRPRPTTTVLSPPATLEAESTFLSERVIRTALVHARPRPTAKLLRPPTTLTVFTGPKVGLALRARADLIHRAPHSYLHPPAAVLEAFKFCGVGTSSPEQDVSGFDHDATVTSAPSLVDTYIARSFNGSGHLTVATSPTLIFTKSVTFAARVKFDAVSSFHYLIDKGTGEFPPNFSIREVDGQIELLFGGASLKSDPGNLIPAATWVDLAVVWDGANATFYIGPAGSIAFDSTTGFAPTPVLGTDPFTLGNRGAFDFPLGGEATLFAYYPDQAFTFAQVQSIFDCSQPVPPAPPVSVRLAGRTRVEAPRRAPHSKLFPPAVVDGRLTQPDRRLTILTALVRMRPRPTTAILLPPATLEPAAVAQAERTIRARLVRTQPRKTLAKLARPTTLQVFSGPRSALVRTRPRPTTSRLRAPTTLQVFTRSPAVLARTRPRPTTHKLFPPATLVAAQAFGGPRVALASADRLTRRRTTYSLNRTPIIVYGPVHLTVSVLEVRNRPPATYARLFPPAVVTVAAVVVYFGPSARTVRTRPRRTLYALQRPTVLQVFQGPRSSLTKVRPRPTAKTLRAPTVIRVPSVEQQEQTLRVRLVQTRPRHTLATLRRPVVIRVPSVEQAEQTIRVRLVQTRPRHTIWSLRPPRVIRVPSVEQQEQTIRVRLVQIRPRATTKLLRAPTVTRPPVVTEITVKTVLGRRPKTTYKLFRPATLEPYSVQITERTLRIRLIIIRPRRTSYRLDTPKKVGTQTFQTGKPTLVESRPRRTIYKLFAPTVLQVFQTGRPSLTEIRPRRTVSTLRPPTVVRVPSVLQQQQTVRASLARIRPPNVHSFLRPPAVVSVIGPTALRQFARTRPARTIAILHPPTVSFIAEPLRARLVRIRPPHVTSMLSPPTVVAAFGAPLVTAIRTRLVRIIPAAVRARLFPVPSTPITPGVACLTDHLADQACLEDHLADEACLTDDLSDVGCLDDELANEACLNDVSAATAKLEDKE